MFPYVGYISCLNWKRVFPKQDIPTADDFSSAKAIRTAGSNAEDRFQRLATSVALLIELKAQFYEVGYYKPVPSGIQLVKWSIRVVKVIFAI